MAADAQEVELRGMVAQPKTEMVDGPFSLCDLTQLAVVMHEEVPLMLRLSAPSVVITVFSFLIWFLNALYAAQLGVTELAAASLGGLTQNLCGFSIVIGLLGAVDTLAPQAVGAQNFEEVGLLVQLGLIASTLAYPLMVLMWLNAGPLLLAAGQPPEVSELAARYLRIAIVGMPARILYELARKFLNAQRIVAMPFLLVVPLVCGVVHPLLLEYCVAELGFDGIAVASVTSLWLMALLCLGYIGYIRPHNPETWPGFNLRKAVELERVKLFARLGCSGLMSMSEWWFWEAVCFLVGRLGTQALAAHSVAYNMVPLAFMIPLGFSIGLNVRVGNLMGEQRVRRAQRLVQCTLMLCTCLLVVDAAVLWVIGGPIVQMYANGDPKLQASALEIWPFMCLHVVATGFYCLTQSVCRALGLQLRSAAVIIGTLWVCGLPLLYAVAFGLDFGLVGLWSCLAPLYIVLSVLLAACFIFKVDWFQIAEAIQLRKTVNDNELDTTEEEPDEIDDPSEYAPLDTEPISPIHAKYKNLPEVDIDKACSVVKSQEREAEHVVESLERRASGGHANMSP